MKVVVNDVLVEMYQEFCRLKGYKLPESPIEALIDESVGAEKAHMTEFTKWFREEVMSRLEPYEATPQPNATNGMEGEK